jgi:type VI secretion system protein ImpM
MRCGLYGKLPSKRDFVAISAPQSFLRVWEPWLQGGLSASRVQLADAWQQAFLRAPIWRLWLGAEICGGATVAGAFMPSVDGVGRYFPLTVFALAERPAAIPPPELDPQDAWYSTAEDFLLSALEQGATFEAVTEALGRLEPPLDHLASRPPDGVVRLSDGTMAITGAGSELPLSLAAVRIEDHARAYAATSVWWTIGGEGFPPLALVGQRMPDPYLFTALLTGRLDGVLG